MHFSSSLRSTLRSNGSGRRRQAAVALAALIVASGGIATKTASATVGAPQAIVGDPQSPEVARLAGVALDAHETYESTASEADKRAFDVALTNVAAATAHELGVSRISLDQAWERADSDHMTAVLSALTQLGVEYRTNTSEAFVGFDCSGLTSFAWRAAGVELPRQSGSQISEAEERTPETAMAGDLVQYPGHVMMYLGVPNAVVHSANPESDVELWVFGDRSVSYGSPSD